VYRLNSETPAADRSRDSLLDLYQGQRVGRTEVRDLRGHPDELASRGRQGRSPGPLSAILLPAGRAPGPGPSGASPRANAGPRRAAQADSFNAPATLQRVGPSSTTTRVKSVSKQAMRCNRTLYNAQGGRDGGQQQPGLNRGVVERRRRDWRYAQAHNQAIWTRVRAIAHTTVIESGEERAFCPRRVHGGPTAIPIVAGQARVPHATRGLLATGMKTGESCYSLNADWMCHSLSQPASRGARWVAR
jgi:hypothetical protein